VTDWGPDLFTLDRASSVPIYVQLAERISTLVTVGTLAVGDKLPSIRSVAEALRVDYNTVAKAYTELDRAGIIHTARGIGTHVTGETDEAALAEARRDNLHSTLQAVIGELVELGYTREEIESAFRDSLSRNG
jgi:GntR family transcriptional regulator